MNKKKQNLEIKWNIINSLLAGLLVLFGSFSNGDFTMKGLCFALIASCLVAVTQFKDYWTSEKSEYSKKGAFTFL